MRPEKKKEQIRTLSALCSVHKRSPNRPPLKGGFLFYFPFLPPLGGLPPGFIGGNGGFFGIYASFYRRFR